MLRRDAGRGSRPFSRPSPPRSARSAARRGDSRPAARRGRSRARRAGLQGALPALLILFGNRGCETDEAENLTQDVLVRVFENIEDYRWQGNFWAWVKTIAVNVLSNHLRDREALKRGAGRRVSLDHKPRGETQERAEERPEAHEPPVALEALLAAERSLRLREALPRLPDRMRAAAALRIGGLKYEEIAETLGVGLNTVRTQLHEAKRHLRRILAASYPELADGEGP